MTLKAAMLRLVAYALMAFTTIAVWVIHPAPMSEAYLRIVTVGLVGFVILLYVNFRH